MTEKGEAVRVREAVIPRRQRRWVIWFDWRNFLIVGGLSLMAVAKALLPPS